MYGTSKINWAFVVSVLVAATLTLAIWGGVFWLVKEVFAQDVSLGARVPWTCQNFIGTNHPMPVSFLNDDNGNWTVLLEDGSTLLGTRLASGQFMKWELDQMHWMTDGKNVVYCESDAKNISILLAQ